jgi:hypothetical protein
MPNDQINPKFVRACVWWSFGGLIAGTTILVLGGGYIMFASAVVFGIIAGRYRRTIAHKIPAAAEMDKLNVLSAWITSIAMVISMFGLIDELSVRLVLIIPPATGLIAIFYYVAAGGQIDVFKHKVLPGG